jgi:hypothetical protein
MNKNLWSLGNEVVKLRQEIDKIPDESFLKNVIQRMLGVINEVRMAVAYPEKKDLLFDIRVGCTEEELSCLKGQMDVLEVSYVVKPVYSTNE